MDLVIRYWIDKFDPNVYPSDVASGNSLSTDQSGISDCHLNRRVP